MTDTTENLIADLSVSMAPVKPAAPPSVLFLKWLALSFAYSAVLLVFTGLRPDLATHLHSPAFVSEIFLLAAIVIASGISAAALAFPDMYQKRHPLLLPVIPLTGFILLITVEWFAEPPSTPLPPHAIECLLCIMLYASLPAFLLMAMLRRHATTHPYLAGGIALLASSALGCLALRLAEETDSMHHLVIWHYLPMIAFATLGAWLGKTLLKW